jgi:hypothetical protein
MNRSAKQFYMQIFFPNIEFYTWLTCKGETVKSYCLQFLLHLIFMREHDLTVLPMNLFKDVLKNSLQQLICDVMQTEPLITCLCQLVCVSVWHVPFIAVCSN